MKRTILLVSVAIIVLFVAVRVPLTQPSADANSKAENSVPPAASAPPAAAAASAPATAGTLDLKLPLKDKSFRFAIIGDNGTGDKPQYDVADQMERFRQVVHYDTVVMLGDNIYGGHKPEDFVSKFEKPYKAQLDNGVKFYASLGNHDDPDIERNYKPFNMNGARYYTIKKGDVEFFALDSDYLDPQQIAWLQKELKDSDAKWKICFFHHPLFSDGKFHGPDLDLRARLMPIFQAANVNLVLSGHDHVYERLKPQNGIYFFVLGSSGQLRVNNLRRGPDTESGDDTNRTFMIMEIDGDTLYFQTISGSGTTVDSGSYPRQGTGK